MNLFSCHELNKTFRKGNFSLQNISLELKTGQITGVVGENGNGKTTLLRIIAGDLSHDHGKLNYFGNNEVDVLSWENIRSRIAYIPQRIPQWYGTLRNNLIFQVSIRGIKGSEADIKVDELLDKLGLKEYAQLKWSEISTGYRLRFQLAKMLLINPELLVLDEPIANLDINAQGKFLSDLRNIVSEQNRKVSVILSSQQLHEIENVADSIIFLRRGAMVYSGEVSKIGETRTNNEFEIQTNLSHENLKDLMPDLKLKVIGKTTHVIAPIDCNAEKFISAVINKGGTIHYFRDISSSTRRLFND
ncbi:MAG: ABC transporter ATP-binding protein [Crocinitomicaceae bacterium]|nr:ABC transporter ATP-binding protein [Crocinitomicaceae bacterium]